MNLEEIKNSVQKLAEDLRLEVILGELMQNGKVDLSKISVHPQGIFFRGSSRDLEAIEMEKDSRGQINRLKFLVHREGLYDALPSGVFHAPKSKKYRKTSKEISEEVREQRAEEQAARDFFQPIEQEFFRIKIQQEQEEKDLFQGFGSPMAHSVFLQQFWDVDVEGIPKEQVTALLYVLPLSYTYKGRLDMVEKVMCAVLRTEVYLSAEWGRGVMMEEDLTPRLGDAFLGMDSVLGGDFQDGMPGILMEIGAKAPVRSKDGIEKSQLMRYLEGGDQKKLIEILAHYFLPIGTPLRIQVHLKENQEKFELAKESFEGRLGYSSVL